MTRTIRTSARGFGVVLAAALALTGACSRSHPLDQQVLAADHLEYLAEAFPADGDRKSTRLNSSHLVRSYAVFCLKKKRKEHRGHAAGIARGAAVRRQNFGRAG